MRIFLSWSGPQSRQVADLFKQWIPRVLQSVEVYMSSRDISAGERWATNIGNKLAEHHFGLSILTQQNINAPWILFEAGAISKTLSNSRLIPILCGIDSIPPISPLAQFQYKKANNKDDLLAIIYEINQQCEKPITESVLVDSFEKWYPELYEKYSVISFDNAGSDQEQSVTNDDLASFLIHLGHEVKTIRSELEAQKTRDRIVRALTDAEPRGFGLGVPRGIYFDRDFNAQDALSQLLGTQPIKEENQHNHPSGGENTE